MNRYVFRVQYVLSNEWPLSEKHCIRALTEAAALADVEAATARYPLAVGASKTITLLTTVAD